MSVEDIKKSEDRIKKHKEFIRYPKPPKELKNDMESLISRATKVSKRKL